MEDYEKMMQKYIADDIKRLNKNVKSMSIELNIAIGIIIFTFFFYLAIFLWAGLTI